MNIYLESVNLDEIRNAASAGLADGIPDLVEVHALEIDVHSVPM